MRGHPKLTKLNLTKNVFLIICGVVSACFGLKSFLLPSGFIDGGVTGISLLTSNVTGIDLSYLILLFNIPFVILGYKQIGKAFAIKTSVAIAFLALLLLIAPFKPITHDPLLIAFFGGLFLGGGIGLAMRGGCVIDGTEVLALYISKYSTLMVGNVILILNIVIFSFAVLLLSIDTALYAILTYLSASNTVDYIVNGIEQYTGVKVISEKNAQIRKFIINRMKRGVTIYKGEGGYGAQKDIDISLVTKLEMNKLQTAIRQIDPDAFVIQQQIADIKGGVVKRQALH